MKNEIGKQRQEDVLTNTDTYTEGACLIVQIQQEGRKLYRYPISFSSRKRGKTTRKIYFILYLQNFFTPRRNKKKNAHTRKLSSRHPYIELGGRVRFKERKYGLSIIFPQGRIQNCKITRFRRTHFFSHVYPRKKK